MKNLYLLLLLFPFLALGQGQEIFNHDGMERNYIYYAPEDIPENAPLIFVLHGYTSSNAFINGYSGFNAIADEHKVAICYPQGTLDLGGTTHWNANLNISTVDDVDFLKELARHLQSAKSLSAEHTFACGMSNGGFMSYTLACEATDVFKAIASVTGTMSGADWMECDAEDPIPVFQISGLVDEVVPVDGSMNTFGGWGGAPDYLTVNEYWKEKNGCTTTELVQVSDAVEATLHSNGVNGNEVWLYPVENMSHTWPGLWNFNSFGIVAAEEIWKFFSLKIEASTSNEEVLNSRLNVFPNPANDFIYLEGLDNASNYSFYSIDGKIVEKGYLPKGKEKIEVQRMDSGFYILEIGKQAFKIYKN